MEQRFKIFIAYHTNEENIATLLSEYFQSMGIPKDFIYLCGLPSNDGKIINSDDNFSNGFEPLKEHLDLWINEKIKEIMDKM